MYVWVQFFKVFMAYPSAYTFWKKSNFQKCFYLYKVSMPDYFLQKSYKKSTNNSCKIGFVYLKPNNKMGVVTAQFSMVVQFKDVKLQENMFA